MQNNRPTLQQVVQQFYTPSHNIHTHRVMQQITLCRTPQNGYHLYQCDEPGCGHLKYQYHSCRNRHCPNCGALKKDEWVEDRMRELLPVKYYHLVFTLPHQLNSLILGNRNPLLKLLFDAASATLLTFAADEKYLGALPGIIAVLHTWGQQLSFHPHLHLIVSGGGICGLNTDAPVWKNASKNDWRFLFPVKAMSKVFRAKYLAGVKKLIIAGVVKPLPGIAAIIEQLYITDWIAYAKAPFGGPQQVIEYLGRYTHKVAITNHRITGIDQKQQTVCFQYKDYSDGHKQKQMTLNAHEFLRRFEQHILPKGFTKIRSYGYLANRGRTQRIKTIVHTLQLPAHPDKVKSPWQLRLLEKYGVAFDECPCCKKKSLKLIAISLPAKYFSDA